ncbi:lipopolysaccharide-induced tumor necrosis factor-alpha factor homolog [Glandiceps talaboti]
MEKSDDPQPYPTQPPYPTQAPPVYSQQQPDPYGYAAPPPPPPPQAQAANTTVFVTPQPAVTTIVSTPRYGDSPQHQKCPHCHQDIVTRTEYKIGLMVWLVCGIMVIMGLWLFCCLIPFCISPLKDVTHHCPNCNTYLGKYDRLS